MTNPKYKIGELVIVECNNIYFLDKIITIGSPLAYNYNSVYLFNSYNNNVRFNEDWLCKPGEAISYLYEKTTKTKE